MKVKKLIVFVMVLLLTFSLSTAVYADYTENTVTVKVLQDKSFLAEYSDQGEIQYEKFFNGTFIDVESFGINLL